MNAARHRPQRRRCPAALALALLATPLPAAAQGVEPVGVDFTGPQATKLLIILVVVLAGLFAMRGVRLPHVLRSAAVWIGILVVLLTLYAYRAPLESAGRELASVLVPGVAFDVGEAVVVRRRAGGHFVLQGAVDGTPVDFLFDTGASAVVLSSADAARAGFDPARLDYRLPVMTASGMTEVAPVRLGSLSVGGIEANDVRAAVARPGDLEQSLLGMTFLDRLSAYEVRRDRLVLTP